MSQAVAALIGVMLTVVFSGIFLESYKRHRDQQGVASAVAGEIYSLIYITDKRQTPKQFAFLLSQLEAGIKIEWPDITGSDPGEDDPVVRRNWEKIGLLPGNLPERIATFYTYLKGIRLDVRNLAKGTFKDPIAQAAIVRADLLIWADSIELGNALWSDLRRIAAAPWWLSAVLQNSVQWTRVCWHRARDYIVKLQSVLIGATATRGQSKLPPPQPAGDSTDSTQALPPSDDAAAFNPPFQELVSNLAGALDSTIIPRLSPMFGGNTEKILRHALIDFQAALLLERACRHLFGSQIDAIIFIGAAGGRCTRDELMPFYETACQKFPDIYANYSFYSWLSFLEGQVLVHVADEMIVLLPPGKAIVSYMRDRQYLSAQPAG